MVGPVAGRPRPARWQRGQDEPVDLVAGHESGPVLAADSAGLVGVLASDHLGSLVLTATATWWRLRRTCRSGSRTAPWTLARSRWGIAGRCTTVGWCTCGIATMTRPQAPSYPRPARRVAGYPTVTNGYHYAHNDPFG